MATNENGILGGFSGKVGTVIGGNWNGVDYMRGKPRQIVNPQTEAQQNQRAKVGTIIKLLRPMTPVLRIGFKKQAHKMSAFNAAVSWNLTQAVNNTPSYFEIDYSKVMISQGKLPMALSAEVNCPGKGQIEFTWEDNSMDKGAMPNDRSVLVVVDPEKSRAVTVMEGNMRAEGNQVVTLPPEFEGVEVYCYLAFQNAKQTEVSNSCFAGVLMVQ